ncbi:MAG: hypothetical protein WC022_03570 [Parcubacteria group bacterium]
MRGGSMGELTGSTIVIIIILALLVLGLVINKLTASEEAPEKTIADIYREDAALKQEED